MPVYTVIAGPNGSGKSTLTSSVNFLGRENLLDPDAMARMIRVSDPSDAAIKAGRDVLGRTREYLERRESFAVETTLSSH